MKVGGKGDAQAWEMDRANVVNLMETKLENSVRDEGEKRSRRNKVRARLERLMAKQKNEYKKFIHKVRNKVATERRLLNKRNKKKVRAIRIRRKKQVRVLLPAIIRRYASCTIFKEDGGGFVPGEVKGPVIVGEDPTLLSKEKVAVLLRGPKFTVEMEKCYIKVQKSQEW